MQKRQLAMERFQRIEGSDRSFDMEYWQRQIPTARAQAMWELAESYHRSKGQREFQLQRSIEAFQRQPG